MSNFDRHTTSLQAVASQIEEIQSRRLPEPPPTAPTTTSTLNRRQRSVDSDDDYIRVDNNVVDSVSPSPEFRHRPMNIDDCTDVDGYLKPTFNQFSTDPDLKFRTNSSPHSGPIPIESYANPQNVVRSFPSSTSGPEKSSSRPEPVYDRPKSLASHRTSTSSENRPLIDNRNVEVT